MEKILFDTDIGSDIDDAVCLAYLLAQPKCELLGVTTVSGEPELRARMVSAMLNVAKRTCPVIIGTKQPMFVPSIQPRAPQAQKLDKWPHETVYPDESAVEFLRKTIRKHPGEITLLAVGPMTNVGLLFATDPDVIPMLKRVVLMCGRFDSAHIDGRGEWNARNDPHACKLVFDARPAELVSFGLNVTNRVVLDAQEVKKRFRNIPLLAPVLDFADVWFEHVPKITFHDPLAGACIFNPAICKYKRGTVDVSVSENFGEGVTWTRFAEDGPHTLAIDVDADAFFKEYFSVF